MTQPHPRITAPGAYAGISAEDYHGTELCPEHSISATGLVTIEERSPAHYWAQSHHNPAPPEPTPTQQRFNFGPTVEQKAHFNIGHLLHDILCYGGMVPGEYHIVPDGFSRHHHNKWADEIEGYDAAVAEGRKILKQAEFDLARAMAESVEKHELAGALLRAGEPEMTLAAQDPKTQRWLRARPDILPTTREIIPDVKTTADAHPAAFERAATNYGYFQAAAHYLDVLDLIYGEAKRSFILITIEKEPPYLVTLYDMDEGDIHEARMLNRRALDTFDRCLSTGEWPGYARPDTPILPLGLTGWKRKQITQAVERGELSYEM